MEQDALDRVRDRRGERAQPRRLSIPLNSVWYRFTPTVNRVYTLDTCAATAFDTTLAVYRGSSLATLTQLAANDDAVSCGNGFQSRVSIAGYAGTTYSIAVDGYQAETGALR